MPYFNSDNAKIFYEETNPTGGNGKEALLLIHGLGSSGADWQEQVNFFSRDFRVITVDLRGHGKSDHIAPFTIPTLAADIISLVQYLKIAPLHIVGLSLGAMVAFQIAVDQPNLLKSLTIVNSVPKIVLRRFSHMWLFYSRIIFIKIFGLKFFSRILAKKLFPKEDQKELRQKLIKNFTQNKKISYLAILRAINGWSVADKIHLITCRTLFLTSENDYTPRIAKEFFAKKINAKLVEIKDAHHALPIEKPQEFNAALRNFLSIY